MMSCPPGAAAPHPTYPAPTVPTYQHLQIIASQIQLFQLNQERQGPAEETVSVWSRSQGSSSAPPQAGWRPHTHAGRDLSRFSRSSRVTKLAKLKETPGAKVEKGRPKPNPPQTHSLSGHSLAHIPRQCLQGHVIQSQVSQAAQLREAIRESGGRSWGTQMPRKWL
jgi:hypothetical protein